MKAIAIQKKAQSHLPVKLNYCVCMHEGEEKKNPLKRTDHCALVFCDVKTVLHQPCQYYGPTPRQALTICSYRQLFNNTFPLLIGRPSAATGKYWPRLLYVFKKSQNLHFVLCMYDIQSLCVLAIQRRSAQQSNTSIICKVLNTLGGGGHFGFSQKELGFLKFCQSLSPDLPFCLCLVRKQGSFPTEPAMLMSELHPLSANTEKLK